MSKAKLIRYFAIFTSPLCTFTPIYPQRDYISDCLLWNIDGVQTYQFSYCSLVRESILTVWIFTFLCHHLGYRNRGDPEIMEIPDGGLLRRADGCGLRATEQITHIRTEWNSQPDTLKESPNPTGDRMKPAEPDSASGLSLSQKTWPVVDFSFSDQKTTQP